MDLVGLERGLLIFIVGLYGDLEGWYYIAMLIVMQVLAAFQSYLFPRLPYSLFGGAL